jgi:hypothetical protein
MQRRKRKTQASKGDRPPLPLGFALCAGAGLVHAKTDTGGNETDLVIPGGAGGVYVGVGVGVSIRRRRERFGA